MSEIRASEIRVSEIRVSEIRISSDHHELHGAIFFKLATGLSDVCGFTVGIGGWPQEQLQLCAACTSEGIAGGTQLLVESWIAPVGRCDAFHTTVVFCMCEVHTCVWEEMPKPEVYTLCVLL